jgi:hypothetical protein
MSLMHSSYDSWHTSSLHVLHYTLVTLNLTSMLAYVSQGACYCFLALLLLVWSSLSKVPNEMMCIRYPPTAQCLHCVLIAWAATTSIEELDSIHGKPC